MKLIFDLTVTQPIDNIKYHGGGKYGEIVFKAIVRETPEVIAYIDSKKWLNPEIKAICDEQKIQIIDASTISIKDIVNKIPSVVYCPVISNDYNSIADSTIYLTTIHGLRVLEMPYDSYAKYYYKRPYMSLLYGIYFKWKSKKIFEKSLADYRKVYKNKNIHTVTVSEHSKASILNFVPELSADKVKVFYSPATVDLNVNANVEPYSIEKYFLIVGANRWIKNGLRALKAFDELFEERPSFEGKVVVTGVTQKQLFLKHLKHKDRFEFLEYVDNSLLASLYKGAYLFVYPSLNEGFGYPPLEAMSNGTPVIASAIASITEVCGDNALYFSPFSISEMKMRIMQMENVDSYSLYVKKAFDRSKELTCHQEKDLENLVIYLQSFL